MRQENWSQRRCPTADGIPDISPDVVPPGGPRCGPPLFFLHEGVAILALPRYFLPSMKTPPLHRLVRALFVPLCLALGLALASCGKSSWATKVSWPEVDPDGLPKQEDFPDAGAVIVLDDGKMELVGGGAIATSMFEHHRIIKIFNRRGEKFAYVVIPYAKDITVNGIEARTIGPTGKISILDPENIFDVSISPSFVFFSDQRAKIFTLPAVENGAILEYRYSMTIRGRTYWNSWPFQDEVPTLHSRFTLVKPSEYDLLYRSYHIMIEPRQEKFPPRFRSTDVWEVRNVPPVMTEFGMPPMKDVVSRMALRPLGFRSWDDVARWYNRLSASRMEPGTTVSALARELSAGAAGRREKLRRVYEWVRDRVRYVAVEVGIGGYQPHPAEQVCVNLYGDCKDMTTLLCSLSAEMGIEVHQALISTWQNGRTDTTLPSPFHFNHVIAYAPPSEGDSAVWMDPTEKGCPFGALPWFDQGRAVLAVGPLGAHRIVVTPRRAPEQNRQHLLWTATIDSCGNAIIEGNTRYEGDPAMDIRQELMTSSGEGVRRWLETSLAQRCSGARLDTFSVSGFAPVQDPLVLSYRFRVPSFAMRRDSAFSLQPAMISASELPDHFRSPRRVHPVCFKFGYMVDLELVLSVPQGWEVAPRRPDALASAFGSAAWEVLRKRDTIMARSHFQLSGSDIHPSDYSEFQRFLDSLRERDRREMVFMRRP